MTIRDWPTGDVFKAASFSLSLDSNQSTARGFYTGNTQAIGHADRLRGIITLPPSIVPAAGAQREAFLLWWKSSRGQVRIPMPHRKYPNGTARGTMLAQAAVAGARQLAITGARAGANLLRRSIGRQAFGAADWTPFNATITGGQSSPDGSNSAQLVTRTATGNHSMWATLTTTAHAGRPVSGSIWIKRGTLTGDIVLRVRDSVGTEYAAAVVSPTASWAEYRVEAVIGGSPAANVQLHVDPANDSGSAGDTHWVWNARLDLLESAVQNATIASDVVPGLAGDGRGCVLKRTATGDHFMIASITRAVAAGEVYTGSCYLLAGTLTGNVALLIQNDAATTLATTTVTPNGAWQRVTVTATFATASSDIRLVLNPLNDAGSAGDTLYWDGLMLEPGRSATDYSLLPTLKAGDYLGAGGNLLAVGPDDATGDETGAVTVPLSLPLQKAVSANAPVTWAAPTGLWELDDAGLQLDYSAGNLQSGFAIPVRQVIA